ncbi:transcriptional regulator [Candidatus Endobugula sertula]|uniref:Probable transcriptional regulatory protein AB835_14730 n=1 Tax=Candidatus Endobugula sertula TaxID=62101 RepID=A0A1D2QL91_9GAMM|nr:transcriptional regulator [Candidatus Endobugula sertula]
MGRAYQNRKESMAKTSDAKAKVYSKYGRAIYVCAKSGGSDPEGNLALRSMIDKAKKNQVPSHVIQKALDKAKGGGGEDFIATRYEGFGPGNCMVIIDCLTDNPNRTFGDVRICFTKTKSKIGTQGSVSHMFNHCAILVFTGNDEEVVLETLMMENVDVTDIEAKNGKISVLVPHTEYFKAKQALSEAFEKLQFDVDEIQFIPQTTTPVTGDDVKMFERFMDMLNDCDDVQHIYHNADISS